MRIVAFVDNVAPIYPNSCKLVGKSLIKIITLVNYIAKSILAN